VNLRFRCHSERGAVQPRRNLSDDPTRIVILSAGPAPFAGPKSKDLSSCDASAAQKTKEESLTAKAVQGDNGEA
jgi:hypothetical protein